MYMNSLTCIIAALKKKNNDLPGNVNVILQGQNISVKHGAPLMSAIFPNFDICVVFVVVYLFETFFWLSQSVRKSLKEK